MAAIKAFGAYLPSRIVTNSELAARLDCEPNWILDVSGIEERRYAAPEESVASMGVAAARECQRVLRPGGRVAILTSYAGQKLPVRQAIAASRKRSAGSKSHGRAMRASG